MKHKLVEKKAVKKDEKKKIKAEKEAIKKVE